MSYFGPGDELLEIDEEAPQAIMKMFQFEESQNWTSYFVEQYIQTVLSMPLLVHETLKEVQYQPRDTAEDEYQNIHGNDQIPLYLPRLEGFASATKITLKGEDGWNSLFKGHLTHFCYRSMFKAIQPAMEDYVNDVFDVFDDINPWTHVLSHVVVGAALSPLELVRTRLIIQSTTANRKKYYGPFHALFVIAQEEKPSPDSTILSTLYSPKVLVPSLLFHSLTPALRYCSIMFIENQLGLDSSFSPILYKFAQAALLAVEALIVSPFEMARKRLFAQRLDVHSVKNVPPTVDACVQTHSDPYIGVTSCLLSVVNEEGQKPRGHRPSNISISDWKSIYGGEDNSEDHDFWKALKGYGRGFKSLYRGFWPRYARMLIIFVSEEITNEDRW